MTGWTPLFQQIVASSVWGQPNHIRVAWITILALANKYGVAPLTVGGLSRMAHITLEEAQEAFDVLSAPDLDTLTQENEGRRIERCETGWRILTWQKYREAAKQAILREQNREAQARYRAKEEDAEDEEPEKETGEFHKDTRAALHIFNEACGRHYEEIEPNLRPISARLNQPSVTLDGIRQMVVRQAKAWKGTDMEKYLRPSTVFNATKFQGYYEDRAQPIIARKPTNQPEKHDRNVGYNALRLGQYHDVGKNLNPPPK